MPRRYTVQEDETLLDIVRRELGTGDVRPLLHHPDNRLLFATQRTSDILKPGDKLVLPDEPQSPGMELSLATGRIHSVVARRRTRPFAVRLVDPSNLPLGGRPYRLQPNAGAQAEGNTDSGGWIREQLDIEATEVDVELGDGGSWTFVLGGLDPAHTLRGVQSRLRALGYLPGAIDGVFAVHSQAALRRFQRQQGLKATGVPDPDTIRALRSAYGE